MKILTVRFQNLNSLAGEWAIDFTQAEYTTDGIFAITGPTGSGKTTLLDAICLALYGRTPRLDRISESTNEIMSRHTGLCFAEIDFKTRKGRFRCHWSQRRAREKSTGKLQQPRHEIVDGLTNKVLENKIKEVAKKVEEVCGMDFDQFTRSVLLAQGGFAAFLEAKADERAPILEQITGTGIYSRISQKVHQKRNEEQQKLVMLEAEIGAASLLPEEEAASLKKELGEKKLLAQQAEKELEAYQSSLNRLNRMNSLKEDIAALETEARQIQTSLQKAEPEKARLDRAQKAETLSATSLQLSALRKQQYKETQEREKTQKQLAALKQHFTKLQKTHQEAVVLVKTAKSAYQLETALCRQVREFDVKLKEEDRRIEGIKEHLETTSRQLSINEQDLKDNLSAITNKDKELEEVKAYQLLHEKDADLAEDLAGIQELGKNLTLLSTRLGSLLKELTKAKNSLQEATENAQKTKELYHNNLGIHNAALDRLKNSQKELDNLLNGRKPADFRDEHNKCIERLHKLEKIERLAKQIADGRKELGEIIQQSREAETQNEVFVQEHRKTAEKLVLQRTLVDKQRQLVFLAGRIHDYEEERKRLAEGTPCPLCGSLFHPFCTEVPIRSSEAEMELQRLEATLGHQQNEDAELKAKIAAVKEKIAQVQKAQDKTLARLENDEKEHLELSRSLSCPPDAAMDELCRLDELRQQGEEILQKIDDMVQKTEAARAEEQRQKDVVHSNLQAMQQAEYTENTAATECKRLQEHVGQTDHHLHQSLEELGLRLAAYGIASVGMDSLKEVLDGLEHRRQSWKQQKDQERIIVTDLQSLRIARERAKSLVEKSQNELETACNQLRIGEESFNALQAKRRDLYQDKDPEKEEKIAEDRVSKTETDLAALTGEINRLEKDKAVLGERLDILEHSLTERADTLKGQEEHFSHTLKEMGFTDEADFQSAVISKNDMEELTAFLEKLTKKEAEIATRLDSKKQSFTEESKKQLTEQSLDQLNGLIRDKTEALNILQQQVGRLKGKLQDNEEQIQKQKGRFEARQRQQREYRRWQTLHDLIGSSDGKKFRNFAQGVTFEIMIGHANRNLQKMNDRYILVRDTLQPLELNVIDTYQAGEVRSTKNLSGGESFIVSLALALGLAGMAGNNVRVDSLFLDEGFGTLDEDSLETALETLACLHQEGKIIGIISHVPVLQERIATRIQVVPGPAGTSRLQGPGVCPAKSTTP